MYVNLYLCAVYLCRFAKKKELMVACEGMYTGQFIYCGKKAKLTVGNVLPVTDMPEGACVCV